MWCSNFLSHPTRITISYHNLHSTFHNFHSYSLNIPIRTQLSQQQFKSVMGFSISHMVPSSIDVLFENWVGDLKLIIRHCSIRPWSGGCHENSSYSSTWTAYISFSKIIRDKHLSNGNLSSNWNNLLHTLCQIWVIQVHTDHFSNFYFINL